MNSCAVIDQDVWCPSGYVTDKVTVQMDRMSPLSTVSHNTLLTQWSISTSVLPRPVSQHKVHL